ncbi:SWI/SNF-related matrix-associated actin-dependent regulator of chromatin subfamily A containing DEAD/H box 1-like isoform X1 [Dinothrombium tinctorium]|uniref:SWI/SNF-related matrix-associated actin-dependent regulator of chromatin subfamily A containing DEAD/H box 1 homolog n=1 Tax=Dinothrombium tinctorium TaxID=1965070 RepID=A0A3S3Q594_9ACAR|nr:SWI/SNF-related matrix-associated actin-dependent regulator of chromatin subfamily A containing DEAD/H box 1-like isoform X1 [Dinothrombium tinctorium]
MSEGGSDVELFDSSDDDVSFDAFAKKRSRKPAAFRIDDDENESRDTLGDRNQPATGNYRRRPQIKESDESSHDEKPNIDEIGRVVFGEQTSRLDENLKRLVKQFPTIDEMDLQDILINCKNNYLNACCQVRKIHGRSLIKAKTRSGKWQERSAGVWLSTGKCTEHESSNNKENHRFDSIKHHHNDNGFNKRSRCVLSDNSSEDDLVVVSNKSEKNQKRKRTRIRMTPHKSDDDLSDFIVQIEDLLGPSDVESANEYEEDDNILSDSESEEQDEESGDKETKGMSKKATFRNKVLDLLQTGVDCDILSIPGVSEKKVKLIKDLRPFENWDDLVSKLGNHKLLNQDLITNCLQTVKSRDVVAKLMAECEKISERLKQDINPSLSFKQPKILNKNCKLTPYQLVGVSWLVLLHERKINGILADEMGLGKTIQVISLIAHLFENGVKGPYLIVVPASTLENWVREFEVWCSKLKILTYYGSQDVRAEIRAEIMAKNGFRKFDVLITTYNMLHNGDDKKLFRRIKFTYVVFDEAHMLKNMKSMRYKDLIGIQAHHRLLLTGTPLQNDLLELMSLLVFTMPSLFMSNLHHIIALFAVSRQNSQSAFEEERIMQAKNILKPFILRRLKSEVLKDLPQKSEYIEKCPMTSNQEQMYMELIEKYTREISYAAAKAGKKRSADGDYDSKYGTFKRSQGILMELRKAANHPLLLRYRYTDDMLRKMSKLMLKEPTHVDANPDYIFEDMCLLNDFELHSLCLKYDSINDFKLDTDLIPESGKFIFFDKKLPLFISQGKRLLIFSQFVMVLDIMEEYMKLRKYKYLRLDGSTKVSERLGLIDEFNDDETIPIFLLSTKAGGLGINLTAADVVIIHDIDFNPYNDKQAEDRCHRVGQTKSVSVYRLISENTVEEGMLQIGEEKLKLGLEICTTNKKDDQEIDHKDVKTLLRQALRV